MTAESLFQVYLTKGSPHKEKRQKKSKQRVFGVLAIVEILNYRGSPIPDPTHKATLLSSMQTNMAFCGQFVSVHSPFPSDLRAW